MKMGAVDLLCVLAGGVGELIPRRIRTVATRALDNDADGLRAVANWLRDKAERMESYADRLDKRRDGAS